MLSVNNGWLLSKGQKICRFLQGAFARYTTTREKSPAIPLLARGECVSRSAICRSSTAFLTVHHGDDDLCIGREGRKVMGEQSLGYREVIDGEDQMLRC